jgi:hypothetical protein
MSAIKNLLFVFLVFALLFNMTSCSFVSAKKVEEGDYSRCTISSWRKVYAEGYFGKFIGIEGGVHSEYPHAKLVFSAQPGAEFGFEVDVLLAAGNNIGKANKMRSGGYGSPVSFYDNNEQVIEANNRVRITGYMIRGCLIKVEKIEKL